MHTHTITKSTLIFAIYNFISDILPTYGHKITYIYIDDASDSDWLINKLSSNKKKRDSASRFDVIHESSVICKG